MPQAAPAALAAATYDPGPTTVSASNAPPRSAHRAHGVHVLAGVHGDERLARHRRGLAALVAEPVTLVEGRLERGDALGTFGMVSGVVPEARGVGEVEGVRQG